MKNARQEQLQYLIAVCGHKLKKLQPHLDISEVTNELYNKILIEKAIYLAELQELNETFFKKIAKTIKNLDTSSRYYICDYFK